LPAGFCLQRLHIDQQDAEIHQSGLKLAARLSPPLSNHTRSESENCVVSRLSKTRCRPLIEQSSRMAVWGQPPVPPPGSAALPSAPARVRNWANPPGCRMSVVNATASCSRCRSRRQKRFRQSCFLAGAHRPGHADTQFAHGGVFKRLRVLRWLVRPLVQAAARFLNCEFRGLHLARQRPFSCGTALSRGSAWPVLGHPYQRPAPRLRDQRRITRPARRAKWKAARRAEGAGPWVGPSGNHGAHAALTWFGHPAVRLGPASNSAGPASSTRQPKPSRRRRAVGG